MPSLKQMLASEKASLMTSHSQNIGEPNIMSEESVEPVPPVRSMTNLPRASTTMHPESPPLENGPESL